jgi:hypothetical protein
MSVMEKTVVAKTARFPKGRPPGMVAKGLRAKGWWHMRERQHGITLNSLLETHADGSQKDARSNLLKYIDCLERVGVLERVAQRAPGKTQFGPGHVVWRLVRDLGMLAPVWRQAQRVLWDPNRQAIVTREPSHETNPEQPQTGAAQ